MANEGSTKPTVNGFCEKHQPNQAVQYAGCWVCSRDEETQMLREVLRAFGWMRDKEAGWYLAADGDDCPTFYDFHDAVAKALDDYDSLREAHKKAHLYGAGQKVRADKLEAEIERVRGLLQRVREAADYHEAQFHLNNSMYSQGIADGLYDALEILEGKGYNDEAKTD